jgi:hypothetical protein
MGGVEVWLNSLLPQDCNEAKGQLHSSVALVSMKVTSIRGRADPRARLEVTAKIKLLFL